MAGRDADSLFARSGEGSAIPFPERALLAACGSAGSAGSGRGEWLGIGAGVMVSGAQEVIATAWPIFDTAFTRRFDESVLSMLKTSPDAAGRFPGRRDEPFQPAGL